MHGRVEEVPSALIASSAVAPAMKMLRCGKSEECIGRNFADLVLATIDARSRSLMSIRQ
jgi:hypothetical protein